MTSSRAARLAIVGLAVSIVFHLVAAVLAGFSQLMLQMLVASSVYAGFIMGLMSGRRWVVWLAFVILPLGMIVAVWNATTLVGLLSTAFWAIVAADLVAIAGVFGVLWRNR